MNDNPLVDYPDLPPFSAILPDHVEPAINTLIASGQEAIRRVTEMPEVSWEKLVLALDDEDDRLGKAFAPVSHLNSVAQTEALRQAYNACLPRLSEYATQTGQNARLYAALGALRDSPEWQDLGEAARKHLDNTLRDFRRSGVSLPEAEKARFMAINMRLSEATAKFSDHVLDATQSWQKHVTEESVLDGLPQVALAGAADRARQANLEGWLLTLDFPCYYAVICHATNRDLREEMYRAHATRASDQGPDDGKFDNTALMDEILQLRFEKARLLGYENYAHMALETRMARDVDEVTDFLKDLAARARSQAKQEFAALCAHAKACGAPALDAWDIPFWSERLRESSYAISDEALRPWFPIEKVLDGLFTLVEKVFGISIRQRTGVDVWHPDVRYYDVFDQSATRMAGFYLDLYARTGKRGGAWMDDALVRRRRADGSLQLPVAWLTCNFAPPAGGKPGLLTHDEVVTLFHEFGHGLHHMLTEQDIAGVSGINGVAWDAVELPSQFMENWCWTTEGLALLSGHYETGEPLPGEMLDKMLAARNFQSAMMMLRQIEFSLFDMAIHARSPEGLDIQAALQQVRDEVAVIQPPSFNRFSHSFSHIFAGGYAAGYYSYKWAEVLSADAWSRFEEEGLFNPEVGESFRQHILAQGGCREPMVLFTAFRGREPSVEPLLKQSGITSP